MTAVSLNLLIQRPLPDESLRSIVDRACDSYDVPRQAVLIDAGDTDTLVVSDWDDLPINLSAALANAMRCPVDEVAACAIKDGPEWLHPSARDAGCPRCLMDDLEAGGCAYSRKSWFKTCSTFCERHRCPLFIVPPSVGSYLGIPNDGSYQIEPALTDALIDWEHEVQTMALDSPVRRLMALTGVNHETAPGQPYAGGLRLVRGSWIHERWPRRRQEPLGSTDPWSRVRSLGEPAYRRAAMYWAAVGLARPWAIEYLPRVAALGSTVRTREAWWHLEFVPALPANVQGEAVDLGRELGIGDWRK